MSSLLFPIQTTAFGFGSSLVELTGREYANTGLDCQIGPSSSSVRRSSAVGGRLAKCWHRRRRALEHLTDSLGGNRSKFQSVGYRLQQKALRSSSRMRILAPTRKCVS